MTTTDTTPRYYHGAKSRIGRDAPSARGFLWIFERIARGADLSTPKGDIVLRPSGTCARCNRPLTVPASLDTGFGPKCADRVGIDWTENGGASIADPLAFVLGGHISRANRVGIATFTASSTATGDRFTYEVEPMRARDGDTARRFLVRVLTGEDNTADYTYLGTIRQELAAGELDA